MRAPIRSAPRPRFIPSLPTLSSRVLFPTRFQPAPVFPINRLAHDAHLFYLARAGVFHAIAHLRGQSGAVLMPAYHHGVEVEAVRATGAPIVFYRVDASMQTDLEDLEAKIKSCAAKVVYLTHFVGFPQPVKEVRELCARLGLRLFEDCALALFSRHGEQPLGTVGDAAVFCLYKSLPVPHGGLLIAPGLEPPLTDEPPLTSTLHHAVGLWLAHVQLSSPEVGGAIRQLSRSLAHRTIDRVVDTVRTGTMRLRAEELHLAASRLTAHLLPRFDAEMVVVRRRRNFMRLAEALVGPSSRGRLEVIGAPLSPGVCPLFVPLLLPEGVAKAHLVRALAARGVEAVDFWDHGDRACDPSEFPEVSALRRRVLELPCHQSLDDSAVDEVAQGVKLTLHHV